jgi:hypothetical protein
MYDEYLEYPLQYQARSALSWLYIIIVNLKRILPRWLKSHVKHDSYSEHERLWNDVFNVAQDYIGMRRGTIRATVLIETITAAFEMDEVSLVLT